MDRGRVDLEGACGSGHGAIPRPSLTGRTLPAVRNAWSSWAGDAFLAAVLFLLPFLFFWRFVTPSAADRVTFARGDFVGQYYPLRYFVAQQFGQGRLPLWDPYVYGGQPALADIQSAAFYPLNALQAVLLGGAHFTVSSLEIQVILHFSLVAVFTFLFVRRLTRSRFAAVVSAFVYAFGGYITSFPIRQMTMLGVGVWLPLILFWLDVSFAHVSAARSGRRLLWLGPVTAAGLCFGISILGGHPQTSLYVAYLCTAFVIYRALTSPAESAGWQGVRERARLLVPFVLVPLIGLGTAAIQLLPTLEFIRHSTRAELSFGVVSWGLPVHELVSLVYPGYSGNSPQYLGILPLVLVAAAIFAPRRWRHGEPFWLGVAVVSLLLSLGANTFLFDFFYSVVPGFQSVRDQERVVFLFSFSMAVLAGCGAQVLAEQMQRDAFRMWRVLERGVGRLAVAMLVLTALFLYGWARVGDIFLGVLRHHVFGLLLLAGIIVWLSARPRVAAERFLWQGAAIGLIAFNLFTVNWEFHEHGIPDAGFFPETGTVSFLRQQAIDRPEEFRISGAGLLPGGSSAGAVYGIRDITGNSPLHLAGVEEFTARMGEWRMWQLLNVRYVLDTRDLDGPGLRRVYEEGELKTYEMSDPFDWAWIVHDVRVVDDDEAAYALLNADDFDLRHSAVVEQPAPVSAQSTDGDTVRPVSRAAERLVVDTDSAAPGLLILSEVYYPGWKALIDDTPASMVPVDLVLRGVPVPAGAHRVAVYYAPTSLWLGAAVSAGTVLCCVLALVCAWARSRD